jgi:hypothetical protein
MVARSSQQVIIFSSSYQVADAILIAVIDRRTTAMVGFGETP